MIIKHKTWVIPLLISAVVVLSGCGNAEETMSQVESPMLSDKSGDNLKAKITKLLPADVEYVEELNEDGSEIIILRGERNKSQSAQVLKLEKKELKLISQVELEPSAHHENIVSGKLADGNRALFIDSGVGAHSMLTEIVAYNNGKLIKIGDLNDKFLFKAYPLYSEDINNDGIIEAGGMYIPKGWEDAAFADIPFVYVYADYKIDGTKQVIEERHSNGKNNFENIDTSKSQFEKGYYDYKGTINKDIPIQMSIYPLGKEIVGTYFYEKQEKKIKLQGKAGENDIILYEYDEKGKNTGMFKGTMSTVDKIQGTWISADNKKQYSFTLSLKSILPGVEYGKRYMMALNTRNDQDVENFVDKIQSYIVKGDKERLSEQITYPITVNISGKRTIIKNREDFIKNYNEIINPNFKETMSNTSTKYLFANSKGIMFGEGLYNIWINEVTFNGSNSKLSITAINN